MSVKIAKFLGRLMAAGPCALLTSYIGGYVDHGTLITMFSVYVFISILWP